MLSSYSVENLTKFRNWTQSESNLRILVRNSKTWKAVLFIWEFGDCPRGVLYGRWFSFTVIFVLDLMDEYHLLFEICLIEMTRHERAVFWDQVLKCVALLMATLSYSTLPLVPRDNIAAWKWLKHVEFKLSPF